MAKPVSVKVALPEPLAVTPLALPLPNALLRVAAPPLSANTSVKLSVPVPRAPLASLISPLLDSTVKLDGSVSAKRRGVFVPGYFSWVNLSRRSVKGT